MLLTGSKPVGLKFVHIILNLPWDDIEDVIEGARFFLPFMLIMSNSIPYMLLRGQSLQRCISWGKSMYAL